MKILFVAWRDLANQNAGGSEVVVDQLASALQSRGHTVSVLAGGPVGPRSYDIRANGGTYTQYLLTPYNYFRRYRGYDLVIDVVNGMPFWSPLWRRGPRVAMLFHVHGRQWSQYFPRHAATVLHFMERRVIPLIYRSTVFTTISGSTVDDLVGLGIPRDNVHLLDLGATVEEAGASVPAQRRDPLSGPMFVALGRLAPNKRLDLLLDHWAAVGRHTGGTLHLVGD